MRRKYLNLFFCCFLSVFIACKRHAYSTKIPDIKKQQDDFDFFKSKAKINIKTDTEEITATFILRMQDAKTIWMSLSKFGKEALRAKLTNDTIFYVNKFPAENRFYIVEPTKPYLEKHDIPLDFTSLQQIFFGNHPLKLELTDVISTKDSCIIYHQVRNGTNIFSEINKNTLKLKQTKIISKNKSDTLLVEYKSYTTVGTISIPTEFTFYISKVSDTIRDKTFISIELSDYAFITEELGFNFTIPEGYEKR